ncbi:MAG TPA: rod shape-determining protein MreB [Actinomycetota bacterium]|nr:rod shape-determining protein MreB [Actinomycetota bacterium]
MGRDLAIDLGTANTVVYREGDGIVFRQPTLVALRVSTGDVVAIGDDVARARGGDQGNVVSMWPMRSGAITEFEVTQRFLAKVLRATAPGRYPKPRVLICIPSDSSPVERRALEEAIDGSGGKQVTLVEETLAAAIGAGLPIHEPVGHLIVDIGGARSEMSVVSMGGVVSGGGVRVGGFDLDAAIQEHIRVTYGVAIGETSAEELKLALGSAFPSATGRAALVVGRELATGNTVEVKLDEDELRHAMAGPIGRMIEAARRTLAQAPPELTHDILETGMFLTGGGSLLKGLDLLLAQECEVPVHIAERPLETVALGAGRMLEHLEEYRSAFQLVRPGGRR